MCLYFFPSVASYLLVNTAILTISLMTFVILCFTNIYNRLLLEVRRSRGVRLRTPALILSHLFTESDSKRRLRDVGVLDKATD